MNRITLLEEALGNIKSRADSLASATSIFLRSAKRMSSAAECGNVGDLRKATQASEDQLNWLNREFAEVRESAQLDYESYLSSSEFTKEITRLAAEKSLRLFEADGRLYCYPLVIQIVPSAICVRIGSLREKNLRPSRFVETLKRLQSRPTRFRPEVFLECLFKAYELGSGAAKNREASVSFIAPLRDLYELLTPLPGQSSEYSLDEFSRDVYLLDRSEIVQTKDGASLRFHNSTGGRTLKAIAVVTEEGSERQYYSVSFTR